MIEVRKVDAIFADLKVPVQDVAPRYFHDYNAAVIATMQEYASQNIRLNDVDVHKVLTRVAEHMFGYTDGLFEEVDG